MSRSMITYDVGELTITAPNEWTDLERANAACETAYGHDPSKLATLALLTALDAVPADYTPRQVAYLATNMLISGWSPGDELKSWLKP